jgi:Asp-tRNA(Asn)/Glu-tRNA(Gln) amidotransferase A subunit family amidase
LPGVASRPVALVDACLERIRARDGEIAAWTYLDEKGARAVAREREAEARDRTFRGPLHGVPVAIKDVINVAGMTTTCGAGSFAHFRPERDAACVASLRAAGAVIVGKVTTTEFAYFEPSGTRNPWNTAHTPGGSSSGSAAAVAARMVPIALGSQTIGSVLRPAAYCGVLGFKGTHGAVPTDGSFPLARSLDHIGIFSRAIADAQLVFQVLTRREPRQPHRQPPPRVALVPELIERATPPVAAQIRATAERLADAGAKVTEVVLPPSFATIHDAGRAVLEGEFATYQEELYRKHSAEYRPRTRGLIDAGLAQTTVTYLKAQEARARFRDDMTPILKSAGILLSPTASGTAPNGLQFTGDPWFCTPWSSIGVPALSLPTAVGSDGLPHAIQLVAPSDGEADLFDAAAWCEGVLGFQSAPPG